MTHGGLPARPPGAHRARDPRGARRQSLPLHRLRTTSSRPSPLRSCGGAHHGTRASSATKTPRLLTGRAQFVDDVAAARHAARGLPAQRSSRTRALRSVDATARRQRARRGRRLHRGRPRRLLAAGPAAGAAAAGARLVFNERTQVPLAKDKVRYVGEPLAMVVAESRYLAEDALRRHRRRSSRCRPSSISRRRWPPARRGVHERPARRTSPRTCTSARATTRRRRAAADVVIARRFVYDRGAAAPIENRAVVARRGTRAATS